MSKYKHKLAFIRHILFVFNNREKGVWINIFNKFAILYIKKFDRESFMYSFVSSFKNNAIEQVKIPSYSDNFF
jgi:hypothetical protein